MGLERAARACLSRRTKDGILCPFCWWRQWVPRVCPGSRSSPLDTLVSMLVAVALLKQKDWPETPLPPPCSAALGQITERLHSGHFAGSCKGFLTASRGAHGSRGERTGHCHCQEAHTCELCCSGSPLLLTSLLTFVRMLSSIDSRNLLDCLYPAVLCL